MCHLISVLIPASNVAPYIEASLESLRRQTHQEFEAIIIVNNSKDETLKIAQNYSILDSRFKVVNIGYARGGIVDALNHGLALCTGAYVARFDADDIMHPTRLTLQMQYLKAKSLDLVGVRVQHQCNGVTRPSRIQLPADHEGALAIFPYRNPVLHLWLCRRDLYKQVGAYRQIPYAEDYDFLGRAILNGKRIGNVPIVLQTLLSRAGNTADTNYSRQVISQCLVAQAFRQKTLLDARYEERHNAYLEKKLRALSCCWFRSPLVFRNDRKSALTFVSFLAYRNATIAAAILLWKKIYSSFRQAT